MFKPKTTISDRLENRSGGAIRTHDLRVMSPTKFEILVPDPAEYLLSNRDSPDIIALCFYNAPL